MFADSFVYATSGTMKTQTRGIVAGEILPLTEFKERAGLARHGWEALLRRATAAGFEIAFRDGRQVYVDTAEWVKFLRSGKRGGSSGTGKVSGSCHRRPQRG